MIQQLRKNFPASVTAETVKKLSIASNNESYVINALQFIGVIDEEGKRTEVGSKIFSQHSDEDFAKGFKELLEKAYADLHNLHGDGMWKLGRDKLIAYFRNSDKTSSAIGQRQAAVFQTFAGLAGFAEVEPKVKNGTKAKVKAKAAPAKAVTKAKAAPIIEMAEDDATGGNGKRNMALTVRVEINLPAGGTRETYDAIFQSIRANRLNA